jgi:phage antirepressor YoqD-like protein
MENNLILSKESSESEIKRYFNAILELSKSDNEFPINLDEVWMLVYPRKDHAVRELVDSSQFIEGVDYQVFLKNGENPKGGRPTNEYKLTVSCMEFFIVRKVRPVFEVYRQVFHKVAKHELSRKELALMVLQSEEEKERLALEVQQKQITIELQEKEIKQAAPKVSYYDNHLQSVNTLTSTQVAKQIGMDAEKLHRKMKEIGILYKQSGQWILHAPYSIWGLHSTRTQTYTRSDGSTGTSVYTVWTTKGVRFIIALYENEWNVKKAIKQIKSEVNPAA